MNTYSILINTPAAVALMDHQFCVRVGMNWGTSLE